MKKSILILALGLSSLFFSSCESIPKGTDAKIITDYGTIYVDLYDETPKHKENFIRLAKDGFFDGSTFFRIMKGFMIQGGDPNTKEGETGPAGTGGPGYTIPREIVQGKYHKRGALAAARQPDNVNPEWKSSGSQFYIVHGRKFGVNNLDNLAAQIPAMIQSHVVRVFESNPKFNWVRSVDMEALSISNPDSFAVVSSQVNRAMQNIQGQFPSYEMTEEMRKTYTEVGGAPMLDGMYSVFGEVLRGMDVVDQIAEDQVNGELAVETIRMTIEVVD